jgi:FkbM family methyltransferase
VWFFRKQHDPIFKKFSAAEADCSTEYTTDFIGSREAVKFSRTSAAARLEFRQNKTRRAPALPPMNEEYFEWISLLRSVFEASGTFNFVELGAGYGRWAARAVLAARQKKIETIRVLMVEAEPTHVAWAREHMANNGIADFSIIEAAVGEVAGQRAFLVHAPDVRPNPDGWYGQALDWEPEGARQETRETYCGRTLVKNSAGWGGIVVDVITLEDVLRPYQIVDLISMDVQGMEAGIIKRGANLLASKVKRIHVGTHSHDIEASTRDTMKSLGWECEWDFPLKAKASTPFGDITFSDGVQAWRNPHLGKPKFGGER